MLERLLDCSPQIWREESESLNATWGEVEWEGGTEKNHR